MFIIGRGRYAREAYPSPPSAGSALRNRNVAAVPRTMSGPFTPAGGPGFSVIAAILFTPKTSGVIDVTALLNVINGASPDTYGMAVEIVTGTSLSVSGGESASDGWVVGSNTPPVVGGVGLATAQFLGISSKTTAANAQTDLNVAAAVSQPVSVGVPVVVQVVLSEVGGGNPIAELVFSSMSILELP